VLDESPQVLRDVAMATNISGEFLAIISAGVFFLEMRLILSPNNKDLKNEYKAREL